MSFTLDLGKTEETFSLSLEKSGFDLSQLPKLEVRIAIDRSGSMRDEFSSGFVEYIVDMMIVSGMKFDDNGSIDVGFFNTSFKEASSATSKDFGKYMKQYGNLADGGTLFYPIFENMYGLAKPKKSLFGSLFGKKEVSVSTGALLVIITDGDTPQHDQLIVNEFLTRANKDTFVQFIGIGNDVNTRFLNGLADEYSNVGFIHYKNPMNVLPDTFYDDLASSKFLTWTKK
jgi:hypothetical protein